MDTGNCRVEKFDSRGVYQGQFGSFGHGPGQFSSPYRIAIDGSGKLWVTDISVKSNRVQVFDDSGNYLVQFGSKGTGDGEFEGPDGIAIYP